MEIDWDMLATLLKAAYATEFSLKEGKLQASPLRPCKAEAYETELVVAYYTADPGEKLLVISRDTVSWILLPLGFSAVVVNYRDKRRGTTNMLVLNFLKEGLPVVEEGLPV